MAGSKLTCPACGEDFRMAYIGFDPPEPYGEVCGCPDEEYADARDEKLSLDREAALAAQRKGLADG